MIMPSFSLEARDKTEFSHVPQSDVNTLHKFITLSVSPRQATWQIKEVKPSQQESFGPTDWMLFALLTFEKSNFQKILEQSPPISSDHPIFWNAEDILEWFPAILKKNLSLENGLYRWRTQDIREAKVFTRSPLLQGYFIPLSEYSQIFLFLYTR